MGLVTEIKGAVPAPRKTLEKLGSLLVSAMISGGNMRHRVPKAGELLHYGEQPLLLFPSRNKNLPGKGLKETSMGLQRLQKVESLEPVMNLPVYSRR